MTERDYFDNIESAEFQTEDNNSFVASNLELEKYKLDPKAEKKFSDINKDSVLGNLNKAEMIELKFIESYYAGMQAIKNQLPFEVSEFFVPDSVKEPALRRKGSTLALSNSKDGFRLKIIASKFLHKSTSESKETDESKKGNWLTKGKDKTEE